MLMKRNITIALLTYAATIIPHTSLAQESVKVDVGADLVSRNIWRGQDLGGVSIQPSLNIAYKGWSLEAWGSMGFDLNDSKEIDLTLGYSIGNFQVSVTDYFFDDGIGYLHYGARNTNHTFEAQIGYDFGPIMLGWCTNFAGYDGINQKGSRAYSSYISAEVPFQLGGMDWSFEVGATPWATDFYNESESPSCSGSNGFAVCNISLGVNKEIKITDSFSVPVFAKATCNPRTEGAYFIFGLNF